MFNKPAERLSPAELETLIKQRRAAKTQLLPQPKPPAKKPPKRKRSRWEKALLGFEILAVAVFLLVTGMSARGWMALRQRLPLDDVTVVDSTVLADGAVLARPGALPPITWKNSPYLTQAPDANGGPQSRPLDTPEHLKRWLQPVPPVPAFAAPQPEARPATRIIIPSIGVDAPVGEGTDWEALKYRVGHFPGSASPGERGNMVLAAHNDVFGEIFRYLPDVPVGEIITIYAGDEEFRYKITERRIITPDQVEVMLPTTGPTTTLISCYPYLIDTHRIVLFGELLD